MNVRLNLLERVILFQFFSAHPDFAQGNAATWRQLEAAKGVLGLTEKENADYGVSIRDNRLFATNTEAAVQEHDYELPDPLMAQAKTILTGMDERNELKEDSFKLFAKLVGIPGAEAKA